MCLAHLDDVTGKLVAHDGGVLGNVGMDALMTGAQNRALVGGHADAVRNNFDQDLVILDLRQLKGIQAQVVGSVQTNGFDFHNETLLFIITVMVVFSRSFTGAEM